MLADALSCIFSSCGGPGLSVTKKVDKYNTCRYVDVQLTQDLTWSTHIQTLLSKARRIPGFAYYRQWNSTFN